MARIEKDIVVNVPVSTAYDQWTQFESFPEFMEGVKEVIQLDEKRLRWRAEIASVDRNGTGDGRGRAGVALRRERPVVGSELPHA